MTVSLKKEKKEQLACLIRKTINKKFTKNKKAWPNNRENSRRITRLQIWCFIQQRAGQNKQYFLQKSKYNYKAYVELFQESNTELTWWQENLPYMFNKISEDPTTPDIYSDVSDKGRGAHFQGRNTGGNWSLEEKYYHINV